MNVPMSEVGIEPSDCLPRVFVVYVYDRGTVISFAYRHYSICIFGMQYSFKVRIILYDYVCNKTLKMKIIVLALQFPLANT